MNILVTGGLGVNGAWISRRLLEQGHRPVIYENRIDTSLVSDIANKLDIVVGDILDIANVIRILKEYKIRRIIHMAALMPGAARANKIMGFSINALGTVNILEAARIMEVERVVFASSKGVYAPFTGEYGYPTYKPVNEDYPLGPVVPPNRVYGATKIASELMGISYSKDYGLEFIALRCGAIYGIGKSVRHGPIAIHGNMIENAMVGKPTELHGGDEKDDAIYVKDYANAAVLACFATDVKHNIFNIGSGKGYSLHDFASAIKKIYPEATFDITPGRDYMNFPGIYCVMDFSRAKEELGYTPKFSLAAGVRDYVESLRKLNIEPVYRPCTW